MINKRFNVVYHLLGLVKLLFYKLKKNIDMKIYKNIEEFEKDWTDEKQKLFQETKERKYGKSSDDSMMLINDRELSEITGSVRFTIPIKNTKQ